MKNLKEIISGLGGQYSPAYPQITLAHLILLLPMKYTKKLMII